MQIGMILRPKCDTKQAFDSWVCLLESPGSYHSYCMHAVIEKYIGLATCNASVVMLVDLHYVDLELTSQVAWLDLLKK